MTLWGGLRDGSFSPDVHVGWEHDALPPAWSPGLNFVKNSTILEVSSDSATAEHTSAACGLSFTMPRTA